MSFPIDSLYRISSASTIIICIPVCCAQHLAVSSTFLVEDPVSLKENFPHTTKKKATKILIRFSISTIKLVSAVASLVEIPSCEIVTALSVLALLFEKLQSWHWHLFARAGDTLIV
jgi:hypothetical protein